MDHIEKFLRRVDGRLRSQLEKALLKIALNDLKNLDIAPLKGHPGLYRCRIRGIRIIFVKEGEGNRTIDMDFRGNVYKKLR